MDDLDEMMEELHTQPATHRVVVNIDNEYATYTRLSESQDSLNKDAEEPNGSLMATTSVKQIEEDDNSTQCSKIFCKSFLTIWLVDILLSILIIFAINYYITGRIWGFGEIPKHIMKTSFYRAYILAIIVVSIIAFRTRRKRKVKNTSNDMQKTNGKENI